MVCCGVVCLCLWLCFRFMVCLVLIILCRIKEIKFFSVALCCCCFSTYKYGNNMQNYPKMTLNSLKIARHRKTKGFTTVSSAKWIFYAEIVFSNKWHSKWQRLIWFYFRMSNAPRIIRFSSAKSINHVMKAIFWILFTTLESAHSHFIDRLEKLL